MELVRRRISRGIALPHSPRSDASHEALNARPNITRLWSSVRSAPIIWVFHGVHDADWFDRCVDEISSARDVVPLAELARNRTRPRICAITFDDGLRSVLEIADPVLRARRLPYSIFVCTEVLTGGPVPWFLRISNLVDRIGVDRIKHHWQLTDRAFRSEREVLVGLKQVAFDSILAGLAELESRYGVSPPNPADLFLSWDDVKDLADRGVSIGSHTHRHPVLSLLSRSEQQFEIEESASVIEAITGERPTEFAYPNGTLLDFDATTIAVLRAGGAQLAVTTAQRYVSPRDDAFSLPRIGLTDGVPYLRQLVSTIAPSLSTSQRRERRLRFPSVR